MNEILCNSQSVPKWISFTETLDWRWVCGSLNFRMVAIRKVIESYFTETYLAKLIHIFFELRERYLTGIHAEYKLVWTDSKTKGERRGGSSVLTPWHAKQPLSKKMTMRIWSVLGVRDSIHYVFSTTDFSVQHQPWFTTQGGSNLLTSSSSIHWRHQIPIQSVWRLHCGELAWSPSASLQAPKSFIIQSGVCGGRV